MYPLSPAKANVERLCEKLKNAMKSGLEQRCGGSFAGFFSSAGVECSQRTGKCMYIKARWNKRNFAGSTKPHCGRGRECPCFAVCALVCNPLSRAECVSTFRCESERGTFVGDIEKRDEKRFGTALWR